MSELSKPWIIFCPKPILVNNPTAKAGGFVPGAAQSSVHPRRLAGLQRPCRLCSRQRCGRQVQKNRTTHSRNEIEFYDLLYRYGRRMGKFWMCCADQPPQSEPRSNLPCTTGMSAVGRTTSYAKLLSETHEPLPDRVYRQVLRWRCRAWCLWP
jgi:hypothetical protein